MDDKTMKFTPQSNENETPDRLVPERKTKPESSETAADSAQDKKEKDLKEITHASERKDKVQKQTESDDLDALLRDARETLKESDKRTEKQTAAKKITQSAQESVRTEKPTEMKTADRWTLPGPLKAMLYVIAVLLAAMVLAVYGWKMADDVLGLTSPDETVTITVSEDDTISDIAENLHRKGLISYEWLFRIYGKLSNAEDKIDPGTYELNKVYDYHAIVNGMIATATTRATIRVTIPEGYECDRIFALLEENGVCTAESLSETAASYDFDYDFLADKTYGKKNRLEGYLFPDTYEFYLEDDPVNVICKFLDNFEGKYTEELETAMEELNARLRIQMAEAGFTEEEIEDGMMDTDKIITVASLIEKEAATASERTKISSVIYNRLCSKLYPCLQIDATVQYALEERKEKLTEEDLNISSPYNTYNNAGLPVGPITNPGLSAIRAALYPADTQYYFYALNADGTHYFSETYYEHDAFVEETENDG